MAINDLLSKWRLQLMDTTQPYLWSTNELLQYGSDTLEELCEDCFLIEDAGTRTLSKSVSFTAATKTITRSTGSFVTDGYKPGMPIFTTSATNPGPFTVVTVNALTMTVSETVVEAVAATISIYDSICHISIDTDGTVKYPIDSRIIRISRARLTGETSNMDIYRDGGLQYLDSYAPDWENADEGTPTMLLTEGVGTDKVMIYPPSDTAVILKLTVFRIPLLPLASLDSSAIPEIPVRFHKYIDNGVYKRAYAKDDEETFKPGLCEKYTKEFDLDKNTIIEIQARMNYSEQSAAAPEGCR